MVEFEDTDDKTGETNTQPTNSEYNLLGRETSTSCIVYFLWFIISV